MRKNEVTFCKIGKHKWEYQEDRKYGRTIRVCTQCPAKQCPVVAREGFTWVYMQDVKESEED